MWLKQKKLVDQIGRGVHDEEETCCLFATREMLSGNRGPSSFARAVVQKSQTHRFQRVFLQVFCWAQERKSATTSTSELQ